MRTGQPSMWMYSWGDYSTRTVSANTVAIEFIDEQNLRIEHYYKNPE